MLDNCICLQLTFQGGLNMLAVNIFLNVALEGYGSIEN